MFNKLSVRVFTGCHIFIVLLAYTLTLTLLKSCISECSIITMLTVEASRVKLTFKTLPSSQTLVRVVITLTRHTCSSHGVFRAFTLASCHFTYLVWSITTTTWKQGKLKKLRHRNDNIFAKIHPKILNLVFGNLPNVRHC